MDYQGEKARDANNRIRNQANQVVDENMIDAVTSEEQAMDQRNVNQAEPIASVQRKEDVPF